jgi:ubiquinone/menaquinone biosynthesis C-methylase UbiE
MSEKAAAFTGSIPENYDRYLAPLFFNVFATEFADRVNAQDGGAVLELACGTGAVTKYLRSSLNDKIRLVATDLNPGMLEIARAKTNVADAIEFEIADGTDLPFEDATFDAIACAFGVMFFPNKAKGFSEAARVLKPGGRFHFTVWDALEHHGILSLVNKVVTDLTAENPITFLAAPFSYHDISEIEVTLKEAGFDDLDVQVQPRSNRPSPISDVLMAVISGTSLGSQLEERNLFEEGKSTIENALVTAFGETDISAPMQALACTASKTLQ